MSWFAYLYYFLTLQTVVSFPKQRQAFFLVFGVNLMEIRVNNQYRLGPKIGAGATGVVHRGTKSLLLLFRVLNFTLTVFFRYRFDYK